ncbi:hypothetical protein THASP1DRAFT_28569 [Thamnocephalis sphaerospora]|uniref:Uncharacterized protein n=1 Tax=Thamnocephalis sphaerospora TaxID=78915 RepID=A0A4P9XTX9_9FUNG|nr:hypothetical protein THASP1DRAFT_28569 [Thamnocephalis sphaerospora]|eukprot:RKP09626.1 hypothetical protein THASP1DRAFT_28569 [Thamnocephalis sphaerospora]
MSIHPLGELNYNGYLAQAESIDEARARLQGVSLQLMLDTFALCIVMRNFCHSMLLLCRAPHKLAAWCCISQTLPAIVFLMMGSFGIISPHGPSCRSTIWIGCAGLIISADAANALLLAKAYRVHRCNRWLLAIGILLILPSPVFTWIVVYHCHITLTPTAGCLFVFPSYLPWLKFALDAPINIFFSVAFIMVVFQQYRISGVKCWADLGRDGFITMLLVVTSNLICATAVAFGLFGEMAEMFWVGDW